MRVKDEYAESFLDVINKETQLGLSYGKGFWQIANAENDQAHKSQMLASYTRPTAKEIKATLQPSQLDPDAAFKSVDMLQPLIIRPPGAQQEPHIVMHHLR